MAGIIVTLPDLNSEEQDIISYIYRSYLNSSNSGSIPSTFILAFYKLAYVT